ncbi:heme peroxidase [Atractiella rhizophila]|nr:heme peroxidase [Atractiella rhizophila]
MFQAVVLLSFTILLVKGQNCPEWPSPAFDRLEKLLFEGVAQGGFDLAGLVGEDCKFRADGPSPFAAEWIRVVRSFILRRRSRYKRSDCSSLYQATYNIDDGTGGLDFSIGYELSRPEVGHPFIITSLNDKCQNVGSGNENSLISDFTSAISRYYSMADLEALGVIFSLVGCGGPLIPFRSGRIDATSEGRAGVPQPQEDLATHIEAFRKQGFNQTEMIQLVACGHSLGGVRQIDFPEIVTAEDMNFFDGSGNHFDRSIVLEYLNGTTANPLVRNNNETITSDGRIFGSDGNVTVSRMAESEEVFQSICADMFERMINTVPKNVVLSDVFEPVPFKVGVINFGLNITTSKLEMTTDLRVMNLKANPSRIVTILVETKTGNVLSFLASSEKNVEGMVLKRMGHTATRFQFTAYVDPKESISRFWFEVDEKDGGAVTYIDNGGEGCGYRLKDTDTMVFWDQVQSYHKINSDLILAAVHDSINASNIYVETWTHNVMIDPTLQTIPLTVNASYPPSNGYHFFTAWRPFIFPAFDALHVHAIVDGADVATENIESALIRSLS